MILEAAVILLAAGILYAALKVVTVDEVVHAVVWLAVVLAGVAGIYVTLTAEFLATIQILVYIGAVITLILFTVMLTVPRDTEVDLDDLDLPPGFEITRVEDLQRVVPRSDAPYHARKPGRRPKRELDDTYGIHKSDEEVG